MTDILHEIRRSLPLKVTTSAQWLNVVTNDLNAFLIDHASCERKAHAAALMMVNRYPDYPELQDQMIQLAREELDHFQQVVKLLRERNLPLGGDDVDTYVKTLMTQARHPRDEHLLDRLMIVAVIEARSCERFCLLGECLPPGSLKDFYGQFAQDESAHFPMIMEIAKKYYSEKVVYDRLDELLIFEATILPNLDMRATVH